MEGSKQVKALKIRQNVTNYLDKKSNRTVMEEGKAFQSQTAIDLPNQLQLQAGQRQ